MILKEEVVEVFFFFTKSNWLEKGIQNADFQKNPVGLVTFNLGDY